MKMKGIKHWGWLGGWLGIIAVLVAAFPAWGQEAAPAAGPSETKVALDTVWTLVTAMLVFFMNLGFAMVESGFCRSKNTVNILSKNFIVFAVSSLAFWVIGWGMMFGDGSGFIGTSGLFFIGGEDNSPMTGDLYKGVYSAISWATVPLLAKFFFQLVFAGTAATIVSGAVAERIKYVSFIVFSFFLVAIIYPIVGHWIWGGGWLAKLGMWDFAGSTVVHSVGGWAALAGVLVLGPRLGKYRDGKVNPILGHNMTSATLGAIVLWLGWFGFNPGSTMAVAVNDISRIVITTNTAGAVGLLVATAVAWKVMGKPDIGMSINGLLAGLVGVTAPCAYISVGSSAIIGAIAGVIVVFAVLMFDKLKIDDPVGALAVHLCCGVFGTLAVGLFAEDAIMPNTTGNGLLFGGGAKLLISQLTGIAAVAIFTFGLSYVFWVIIKAALGVRVSEQEEMEGLDFGEHGNIAYPDFVISSTGSFSGGYTATPSPSKSGQGKSTEKVLR
ncbi:MAG: ammonium transporter [Candidatus Manganitrophaceae bacterium]